MKKTKLAVIGAGYMAEEHIKAFKDIPNLVRCTKCLLPHTFPFIKFNQDGVCNYCLNHKPKSKPKPKEDLFKILEKYTRIASKTSLESILSLKYLYKL